MADDPKAPETPPEAPTVLGDTILTVLEVDSAVVRYPESVAPAYPTSMLTKNIEGKTNRTRTGTILMVVFAACSSARCLRSVRRESECTRRAWATLVPKRSV